MNRLMPIVPMLILLCLAALPARAQEEIMRACTQMWCDEGMTLELRGSDWPAGRYDFRILLDGVETGCTGKLPLSSCETPNATCDNARVTIGESGCAMPGGHSFHAVMTPDVPARIGLTITHESGKTFRYESAVEESCGYPNGKECDPNPCCSAHVAADIAWE